MVNLLDTFLAQLTQAPAVLVMVARTEGSAPREPGAWIAVFAGCEVNTLGGGHVEFEAIAQARVLLARYADADASADTYTVPLLRRFALGPSLGQCCGGVVHLSFERVCVADATALRQRLHAPYSPVALFGGGHVGKALVQVLGMLPLDVRWIDSRDEIFPASVPSNVQCEHSDPVHLTVDTLVSGSQVLIMSFSHAEDLDVVAACLRRNRAQGDLPFVGLIGSRTKWATFRQRLEARGFSGAELMQVTSPIGVPGINGKQPEVIAIAVAAQLLQQASVAG